MSYGVPNPYVATTHPYPTRFHGGIWTRPVFGLPYQGAVQSVFKPDDFNAGNPLLRNAPTRGRPLGELQYNVENGVFGTGKDGGGVFGPSLYGLGGDCALPKACVDAKARASQYFNTSLLDGYCNQDGNAQNEIWGICTQALEQANAAGSAAPAPSSAPITADQVTSLQKLLNASLVKAGYPALATDGKLGPGTCGAIAWYQKQTGNPQAGVSFASACAAKQPWIPPTKSTGAPLPGGPATYAASATQFTYTPPSSGPSKAVLFAVGGGLLAVIAAVVAKKKGWV